MDASVSHTHGLPPKKQDPGTGYRSGSTGLSDNQSDGDSVSANGTDSEDEAARLGSEAMQEKPDVEKRPHKPTKPNQLTKQ